MKICTLFAATLLLTATVGNTYATTYNLPSTPGDSVIAQFPNGGDIIVHAPQDETLLDVARDYLLGQVEIVRLNQNLDRWHVRKDEPIRLPNKRILPDSPHQGVTLNISEYRMYFYPANQPGKVMTFPHGVGRQDWKTPLGQTSVVRKVKDPVWYPPETIRMEHAANGDPLDKIVPAGPHNPLGAYALYLKLPGDYRIHGTDIDKIDGIGMQVTHGCVRLYPKDIEQLFQNIEVGTPVYLVKQPIKVGWLDNVLYIEAHPDLEGDEMTKDQRYAMALALIQKANGNVMPDFDQVILNDALDKQEGVPVELYERLPPIQEINTVATPSGEMPAPTPPLPINPINPIKTKPALPVIPAKPLLVKAKPVPAKLPVVGKLASPPAKDTKAMLAKGKPIDAKVNLAKLAKGKVIVKTAAKALPMVAAKPKTAAVKTAAASVKPTKTKPVAKATVVKQTLAHKG